jgi:CRP-like cAMP-binding protein/anti-anti-sigma regulatory factor
MAADALSALLSHAPALPWRDVATAGVTVALLGSLETLGTVSVLTDAGIVTDGRTELNAAGIASLAVAMTAGGPPVGTSVVNTLTLWQMGARSRLAPVARLVTLALGGVFLGRYLPLVPQGVLVGLVLTIGYRLVDPEPARLLWRAVRQNTPHRFEIAFSALISLAVVAVAATEGLAVAVAAGAAACLLVFTAAMAGSAVRRVYDGAAAQSRVRRSADEDAALLRERRAVAVLELAGPLFFGNVSPLGHALDQAAASGARHVVIDLSRIVRVDLSGARRLVAIVRQSRQRGLTVVLAPIRPGHPVADYFAALDIEPGECFAEITDALAAAEAAILVEAGLAAPTFDTAEAALLALGVPAEHAAALASRAETRDLAAGEALCRGGEPADAVFVLMRGQADVLLSRAAGTMDPERVLLAHLAAGAVIGEQALFEAGTRSADVVCTVPTRVMILSAATLAALAREATPASLALVLAIARHMSVSLQLASAAIQRLEV